MLYVVSAPSGTGKTTVLTRVLGRVEGLRFSVSHTTRSPRSGERDGHDYHFVDRPEFERRVADGRFLEWAEVHGELYGTLRSQVDAALRAGKNVLLDIDVQGGRSVRTHYPDGVFIFVLPPSMESLEARLRKRGTDSEDRIHVRLQNARREMEMLGEYDYAVVNDDLAAAQKQVASIIVSESLRVARRAVRGAT